MAFAYKTPMQSCLGSLQTEDLMAISGPVVNSMSNKEIEMHDLFNFSLPSRAKEWLTLNGVYLSPYSYVSHSHPVCKTLENHMLYTVVNSMIGSSKINFVSVKDSKFKIFKSRSKNNSISHYNRAIDAKDFGRYDKDVSTFYVGDIDIKKKKLTKNGMDINGKVNDNFFIHDEVHHWDAESFTNFVSIFKPNRFIFSIIHPVEIFNGFEKSATPWAYEFKIRGDKMFFFPDGKLSEAYEQPRDLSWLFKSNKFIVDGEVYTLKLVKSLLAHHVFELVRGDYFVESVRFFNDFECIDYSMFNEYSWKINKNIPIPHRYLVSVYTYLKCLKKPDFESGMSKIRQLEENLTGPEVLFFESFIRKVLENKVPDVLSGNLDSLLSRAFFGILPTFIKKSLFKSSDAERILGIIAESGTMQIEIECGTFDKDTVDQAKVSIISPEFVEIKKPIHVEHDQLEKFIFTPYENKVEDRVDLAFYECEANERMDIADSMNKAVGSLIEKVNDYVVDIKSKGNGDQICMVNQKRSHLDEKEKVAGALDKMCKKACMSARNVAPFVIKKEGILEKIKKEEKRMAGELSKKKEEGDIINNKLHKKKRSNKKRNLRRIRKNFLKKEVESSESSSSGDDNDDGLDSILSISIPIEFFPSAESEDERGITRGIENGDDSSKDDDSMPNLEDCSEHEGKDGSEQSNDTNFPEMPNNSCMFVAFGEALNLNPKDVWEKAYSRDPEMFNFNLNGEGSSCDQIFNLCILFDVRAEVMCNSEVHIYNNDGAFKVKLIMTSDHIRVADIRERLQMDRMSKYWSEGTSTSGIIGKDFLVGQIDKFGNKSFISDYSADCRRASMLLNSMCRGTTGIWSSKRKNDGKSPVDFSCIDERGGKSLDEKLITVFGFAGCGKSRPVQDFLRCRDKKFSFLVISPRKNLKSDWESKIDPKGVKHSKKVKTFESALKVKMTDLQLIVIDEIGLFPNGYLDLLILKSRYEGFRGHFVVLGDPLQANYHSDTDFKILDSLSDVDKIVGNNQINYMNYSFRLNSSLYESRFPDFRMFGAFTPETDGVLVNDSIENIIEAREMVGIKTDTILVSSFIEKRIVGSHKVMTFGESQGLTFSHAIIMCTNESLLADDRHWMVALTRSRQAISLCVRSNEEFLRFREASKGRLIDKFLNKLSCMNSFVKPILGNCTFVEIITPGASNTDEMDREERLQGDLFLKPFINLGQRIQEIGEEMEEIEKPSESFKTHISVSNQNFMMAKNFELIKLKERREVRMGDIVSNQFTDKEHGGPRSSCSVGQSMRYEAIYPRHKADDTVTFIMACRKRLMFSEPTKERMKLKSSRLIGEIIFKEFNKKLNLDGHWDQNLYMECVNEFEVKKLSKSIETLRAHSIRSDRDWRMKDVFIFMKSQLCTKFEKRYVEAKAGQTLACFHHLVLVKFAPMCRYLEKKIRNQMPKRYYIHSNKNFDDLEKWVVENNFGDVCTESDYESFDASQDHNILAFEVELLKFFNVDRSWIEDYIELKTELSCKLGNFAIMRFTGEFCTFLFNTLANMAFTFCRYKVSNGTSIAFAGDDMCANEDLTIRHDLDDVFKRLKLQAKVCKTRKPMFCGWNLNEDGIIKNPMLVMERFLVAEERGNLADCIENYAIEVSYAYNLRERLFKHLNEEELEVFQLLVRFIIKRLHLVKGKIKNLFSEEQ